jgi:hypothetical protein
MPYDLNTTPDWMKFALTNYHLVHSCIDANALKLETKAKGEMAPGIPSTESDCMAADKEGVLAGTNITDMRIAQS